MPRWERSCGRCGSVFAPATPATCCGASSPGSASPWWSAAGDLFDEADANLVVGFADTFDTATENDAVISRASVQGQLLDRLTAATAA